MPHGLELSEDLGINFLLWDGTNVCVPQDVLRLTIALLIIVDIVVLLDEGMPPHLLHGNALQWVDDQDLPDKVLSLSGEITWHLVMASSGLLEHDVHVGVIEGETASQHGKQDTSHGPDVHG